MSQMHQSPSLGVGRTGSLLFLMLTVALQVSVAAPRAQAAPKTTNLQGVIPTVTSLTFANGEFLASGIVSATIHGTTTTAPFSNVPVTLSLDPNQPAGASCPILDLHLGPITVNLLGLVVQTSPICLAITANSGGGLLGDLLCQVANLLNGGLSLNQILAGQGLTLVPGLTSNQVSSLISGLTSLLNSALQQLLQAVLATITPGTTQHTCAILNLTLGPLDLTLLGLNVHLDNCSNGPVTVTITGVTGQGNLLGNLLCQLLAGGQLQPGLTLQQIINLISGLLNV